ncbi:phosphonate C-P lyase system protein PhnH [Acidithiobacillus ferrooxidans]|uniref:phosphonate C-P lyase system protein PhnH n=1 Tax=Acidithiobacillus ferrooxidans TaxID=920 RepID=UPI00214CBC7F|nr:phosphonate C-P lyase system protein PhnH [Acidithiobacillus ferrooxidans]MCR2831682.1 phosphonate C-P lyase system protein PhnH [Acidithiobacillus ferrooxidans]
MMTLDYQLTFRMLLEAMSCPGQRMTLPDSAEESPFRPACTTILHTLLDADTPVALAYPDAAAEHWLRTRCYAPVVPPKDAVFAVATDWSWEDHVFPIGTEEEPENSATLIIEIPTLQGGPNLILRGPGIQSMRAIAPEIGAGFLPFSQHNHSLYPRGVDLILCSGRDFLCLPRTTEIEEA